MRTKQPLMASLILCASLLFANQLYAQEPLLLHPVGSVPHTSFIAQQLKKNETESFGAIKERSMFRKLRKAEKLIAFAENARPKYPELDVLRPLISVCNQPLYHETISGNAWDLLDFFEDCKKYDLPADVYFRGITHFHDRSKACEIMDDTVVMNLLDGFASGVGHVFAKPSFTFSAGKNLKNLYTEKIAESLYNGYDLLKTEPTGFVKKLARELERSTVKNVTNYEKIIENRAEIRSLAVRFFEQALSKTMWNYLAYQSVWASVLSLAHGIRRLQDYNIVTNEHHINSLYWSLTHRFCFFIDFIGSAFPVAFYEEIENDITNGAADFLDWEESEHNALTKRETLYAAIAKGKMKAMAMERHGTFSDVHPMA